MRTLAFTILITWQLQISLAFAQDWAELKGRFVLDRQPPERKEPKHLMRDPTIPAEVVILDESLIVDPKTRGIANILLWVISDPKDPAKEMPIHRSYAETPPTHEIVIKNQAFVPHVSAIRSRQSLSIVGGDRFGHNAHFSAPDISLSGLGFPSGDRSWVLALQQQKYPIPIACSIHAHESAWLLVRDNPYFAVTNENGEFEIKNLPVGKWRFKVWQERCGWITNVQVAKKPVTWTKGEVEWEITKEGLDLGTIVIPASTFDKR